MLDVSYEIGKIAFHSGVPCKPGQDEFYSNYIRGAMPAGSPDFLRSELRRWETGWRAAQADYGAHLNNQINVAPDRDSK